MLNMHEEPVRRPLEADIDRAIGHTSRHGCREAPGEVVGLDFGLDRNGYCKSIYSSSDPSYSISSAEDVFAWLTKKDVRLLFVADNDWMGPLLKWFGEEALVQYKTLKDGYPMRFGNSRITYLPGNGYANILIGRHRAKRVNCLQPFYHMYGLPPVTDAEGVKDLSQRIVNTQLKYGLSVETRSPGAMLQSYLVRDGIRPTSVTRIPKPALDMATNCYHTNLIAAVGGGRFSKSYDYDIVGAYPSHTATLLSADPAYGDWVQSSTYQKDAFYGFCRVVIRVVAPMTPFLCRIFSRYPDRWDRQANPVGTWHGWLTKLEIDFAVKHLDAVISIEDGWWFVPTASYTPFKGPMLELNNLRQGAKDTGDKFGSNLLKLAGVSAQGKYLSAFPSYGKLVGSYYRNPVYASYITAGVRCKVGEFILDNWGHVLNVAVDGVALDRPVDVPDTFGEFALDSNPNGEECIIAGDGIYWRRTRQSVFQKSTLERYAESDAYPDLRSPSDYSIGQAAMGKCSIEQVGTAAPTAPDKVPYDDFARAWRHFRDKPVKCDDLLTKQFDSEARPIVKTTISIGGKK